LPAKLRGGEFRAGRSVTITIDTSVLLGYYQARYGGTAALSGGSGASAPAAPRLPTAPWDAGSPAPRSSDLVRSVLAGRKFIDVGAAQLDVKGASDDYRKLFALYQGLNALSGLAERAGTGGVSQFELGQLRTTFASGMTQVAAFMDTLKLAQMRLSRGESLEKARTEVGIRRDDPNYITQPLHTGTTNDAVAAFQGEVKFDITLVKGVTTTTTTTVSIDLADMGATPRTMSNVVIHLNDKLAAAGATSRFAVERIPAEPRTVKVGDQTITLPGLADSFALKLKGDLFEKVSFSAPATAGAVYLAGAGGTNAAQQLLKFQTDLSGTATPPPSAFVPAGSTFNVDGRVFAKPLGDNMTIRQTVAGPDGSLYALAEVTDAVDGQAIKGDKDVALIKYDSQGNVLFTRTLGAVTSASGFSLAVAADGRVAVAGSVTGALDKGDAGADAAKSDSFVTVFDAAGEELWTQRRTARENDEATAVAFGDDGTVYVAGRAKTTSAGSYDNYLEGYAWNGLDGEDSLISKKFTQSFGTTADDSVSGIAIEGSRIVLAGVENGKAVLRGFDVQADGTALASGVRDLGSLQGSIAGVSLKNGEVILAGTTANAALSAGTVTTAHGGGKDAFVARLDASLGAAGTDRLTYLGGDGEGTATAMTVVDGKVWLTGTAKGAMPGTTAVGDQDGYLIRLDAATGAQEWTRRFTSTDRTAAPAAIAFSTGGASVLDRLGLPSGELQVSDSKTLTANSAVRAGDQFLVRTAEGGRAEVVTIAADDTLQSLALKIQRAAGFMVKVSVVKDGDFDKLEVKAMNDRSTIELTAGPASKAALEALGLSEGVVRNVLTGSAAKTAEKTYGLDLDPDLSLSSETASKAALANLQAALGVIRTVYRDLKEAAEPKSAVPTGPAPAYLTAQIANYTAALNRLTGGG
jgi:hypothetical protein